MIPRRCTALIWLCLLGASCGEEPTAPAPTCTEGVDCPVAPMCGDAQVDDGEACDDGNPWGGDGCTPTCAVEEGILEVEPNDDPAFPQDIDGASSVHGALPSGDRDCFALTVPEAGMVTAKLAPDEAGGCSFEAVVELFDDSGVRITSGLPGVDGCATIDASLDTWARYLSAGEYALCVGAIFDQVVPAYTLTLISGDSCSEAGPPPDPTQDLERDGIADVCDDDDDNDGVLDTSDNCPAAPNGPQQPLPWDTSDDGFVRLWLVLGPFTSGVTPGGCEPSLDSFAGMNDSDVAAAIGDSVGATPWFAHYTWPQQSAVLRFTDWFMPTAPREAYAMTWLYAPNVRNGVLAIGADDGLRVWFNGDEVGMNAGCQGVATDQFKYPVTVQQGWNRLLTKVYDGGGGWGQVVRVYYQDEMTPMTDLDVSIAGPMPWLDNQGDLDMDGIGDICDPDPTQM